MSLHRTRHTLLERVCNPNNELAWSEFVRRYHPFINYILQQVGVEHDEIEDVTQQILLTLTRDLPNYDRTRAKFRTWLGSVIRHAAFSHLRKHNRREIHLRRFGREYAICDSSDNVSELDTFIEEEWTSYVSKLAFDRVREIFQGHAIKVFELSLDGVPIEEIASHTDLAISSVYTLKKRVKKRLYLEIRAITRELER